MLQPQPDTSSDNLIQCNKCSQVRFFKGIRGLRIHLGKAHKDQDDSSNTLPLPQSNDNTTPTPFWKKISTCKQTLPILKRIPRAARITVCETFSQTIRKVINENSLCTWENLLLLPYQVLNITQNDRSTATSKIKKNCKQLKILDLTDNPSSSGKRKESTRRLTRLVESKLSDGDIKGAARILFSDDDIAPCNEITLRALADKHPPSGSSPQFPDEGNDIDCLRATSDEVLAAVMSFKCGSAGGLDGLTPQHLKDLLSGDTGSAGEKLLKDMTDLVNLMLSGTVTKEILPILYGANLCALTKKDKSIRPIAVGMTYRRLAAKLCCRAIKDLSSSYFLPHQLGFGTKGGCEAAVHSLRAFTASNSCEAILKVDVKNAFNSVNRSALLNQIKRHFPKIYRYVWQCYGENSFLLYKNHLIYSATGCQQGDPLGPAIFSLAIHPVIEKLNSKFNVWYLDDGTLGGDLGTLKNDLAMLTEEFGKIDLELNFSKCELFINENCDYPVSELINLAPNLKIVSKNNLTLLGAPVFEESFNSFFDDKIQNFTHKVDNLKKISKHSAYFIIRHCLFVPNFTYVLRCSPLWRHPNILNVLDSTIRQSLTSILNLPFDFEDRTWTQATLPIRLGGLGIRKISDVALPAFLSSVYSTVDLIGKLINPSLSDFEVPYLAEARNAWSLACPSQNYPVEPKSQKLWDGPLSKLVYENLMSSSVNETERARLLAVSTWESGLWLQALPSSNLGTFLDDTTFRIAASIRLGAPAVVPHHCQCGDKVGGLGHHGLSCVRSAGRIPRHAALNDIIRRALVTTGTPAILEPNGLCRDDGKRPDGMSLVPWKMGRPIVWDATCVDTLAASHLPDTAVVAGAAAARQEDLKRRKYASIGSGYIFAAFGVETLGPWGPEAHRLYRDLSKRLIDVSRNQNAGLYFGQRISVAIQRGNAASVLGTFPADGDLGPIYYL